MGFSIASTPWFSSRLGIYECHTCEGVTIFELPGDDFKICYAPEARKREVYILVVEAQEFR